MDEFAFFEPFFQSNPQHARLFKILKGVAAVHSGHLIEHYLASINCILENMNDTFLQQRSDDFFHMLMTKLLTTRFLPEDDPVCETTFFSHSVAFPFRSKGVVGFFTNLSGIQPQTTRLIDALCKRYENIALVRNSVLLLFRSHQHRTILYFEVQKAEGHLSPDEIQDLQESLEESGTFMVASQQESIPSLESSIKTLRWLMSEVEKGDLPHVMISLEMHSPKKLRFFAFVCQFISSQTNALAAQQNYPGSEIECQFRKPVEGGIKEGTVLKIDLPNTPSLLVEKRQQVSRLIESYVGPFRDVNGGLLEKIEQNFEVLAKKCPGPTKGLREFFDSITPESERATCPPALLQAIYLAIQKKEGYTPLEEENAIAAVVRVEKGLEKTWKKTLSKQFPKAGFSETLTSNAAILSCFLRHPSQEEAEVFKAKTTALFQEWTQNKACQTLRLCTTARFTSFDPRTGTEEEVSYLHKMLFEGLMRIGPCGKPEPAIAKKVTLSKDKMRYTFHLRKSCWSNRMPLTAHDFLYIWNMTLTKKELAPLSYLFDRIENAQEIRKGEMPLSSLGVDAVDDYTLEVRLRSPCAAFLEICTLTLFSPICQAIDEKHPSWIDAEGDEYVCNGPFCLEKKDHKGGVVLKRNPFYWESEKTRLERITIPVVSQEEGERLFRNKQVDALFHYFYNTSPVNLEGLEVTHLKGVISKRFLCLNCAKPPFHNKKVRQAIALAMDRKKILKQFPHNATPSFSFYSPLYSQNRTDSSSPEDTPKAQQLLMQALAEEPEITKAFFNQSISALEGNKKLACAICDHLNTVFSANWTVSTLKMNAREYLKRKKNLQVSIFGWSDRIDDPWYFLELFSSGDNFINPSFWTHPSMQTIIEKVKTAKNREERDQLLSSAEALLFEEMPMVPLFDVQFASICHPYVQGIYASRLQQSDIRFASKQRSSI